MNTQIESVQTTPAPCSEGSLINRAHTLAGLNVPRRDLQRTLLKENKQCSQPLPDDKVYLHVNAALNLQKSKSRSEQVKSKQHNRTQAQVSTVNTKPAAKPPDPIPTQTPTERMAAWSEVERFLSANFLNPDIAAAKIIYATVASHRINRHAPAWLLPIAPPGSMKTELLKSCEGLPGVHLIDEVTENTFISGELDRPGHERTVPASLLHRIGEDGIIIVPDFSTILEMNSDKRGKILSQLRRIYDGQLRREFGTSENLDEREWKGRITLLAGTTPEVDRYYSVLGALGDRFVQTRWARAGSHEAALRAMEQGVEVSVNLKKLVREFLLPTVGQRTVQPPEVPSDLMMRLAHFSEFIVHARAYVPRSSGGREIDGLPQIESNTRLPQELIQIGRGWAALMGHERLTDADFELVIRAGWDTIPPARKIILVALARGQKPYSLGLAGSVVKRQLEDLDAIGLVRKEEDVENEISYFLSDKANELLTSAGLLETLTK